MLPLSLFLILNCPFSINSNSIHFMSLALSFKVCYRSMYLGRSFLHLAVICLFFLEDIS